jgi:hypothetical protein
VVEDHYIDNHYKDYLGEEEEGHDTDYLAVFGEETGHKEDYFEEEEEGHNVDYFVFGEGDDCKLVGCYFAVPEDHEPHDKEDSSGEEDQLVEAL